MCVDFFPLTNLLYTIFMLFVVLPSSSVTHIVPLMIFINKDILIKIQNCHMLGNNTASMLSKFFPQKNFFGGSITKNHLCTCWQVIFVFFWSLLQQKAFGDISERMELRVQLRCKSFLWYLKNIYPEAFIPDLNPLSFGSVRSHTLTNTCLPSKPQRSV